MAEPYGWRSIIVSVTGHTRQCRAYSVTRSVLMGSGGGKTIMTTFSITPSLSKESHVPKTRVLLVETTLVIMPPVYIDGASRSPQWRTGFGRDVYTYYGSYGVGRWL